MSLKPCRECGEEVGAEAKACPRCGASNPAGNPTSNPSTNNAACLGCAGMFVGAVILVGILANLSNGNGRRASSAAVEYQAFRREVDRGASCAALFEARNRAPQDSPNTGRMNADLGRIGCRSSTSARTDR